MITIKKLPNCESAVISLINTLNVNLPPEKIVNEFLRHPQYPSLFSITEVLKTFHIDSYTFKADVDELEDIVGPFLALTHVSEDELVLVKRITNDQFELFKNEEGNYKLSRAQFRDIYKGIVLVPDADYETLTTRSWFTKLRDNKNHLLVGVLICIFCSSLYFYSDIVSLFTLKLGFLMGVKLLGLITAILLLIQSVDNDNSLVNKLCKGGKHKDCNTLLTSDAAKIIGNFSWSDLGFSYFAGTFLILLVIPSSIPALKLLQIINLFALPYTVYSIYFQAFVIKKWCPFCCVIQATFWLEFIGFLLINKSILPLNSIQQISPGLTNLIFSLFLLPGCVWLLIKPILQKLTPLSNYKYQLRYFKYNLEAFAKKHAEQPKYTALDKPLTINLGNPEALLNFTVVTSPYCRHCAQAHKDMDELLKTTNDVNFSIVLMADNLDNGKSNVVCRHLIALNQGPDKKLAINAIKDWYTQPHKNYKKWAAKYPVSVDESSSVILQEHWNWCRLIEAQGTPTVLLNGRRIPENYILPDLKYLFN